MRMKIHTKLMLGALVGVLGAVSVVSLAAYAIARSSLESGIRVHLASVSRSRARHVATFLHEQKAAVGTAATSIILADGLRSLRAGAGEASSIAKALNERLELFLELNENIYEFMLLDRDGKVVASTDPQSVGLDRSGDAYFVGATDVPFIKDAYYSQTTGKPSLTVSAPLVGRASGELLGILVARHDMIELDEIVTDRTGLGNTGETYLINKYGFMITPSRSVEDTFLKQKIDTENARECLEHMAAMRAGRMPPEHEHEAAMFPDYRDRTVLGVHAHIPEMGWGLLAEIDVEEAFAPIARLRSSVMVFAALLAGAAMALAYLFARRLSGPIHELHVGSERIGKGELDHRVRIHTGDEIEQLADEFNRMAQKLQESYTSLEQKVAERTAHLDKEVAERKRSEEALGESEERYRSLTDDVLESSAVGIFVLDADFRVVWVNKSLERFFGLRRQEIIGKDKRRLIRDGIKEIFEDGKGFAERVIATYDHNTYVENFECHVLPAGDREERHLEHWSQPIKSGLYAGGRIEHYTDITERKRAEEELRRYAARLASLNAELERSNRDLQDFTYTASHDLQEPLRKIHTFGEFLVEDCGEALPEEAYDHLDRIQDATVRMKALIEHLLALARVGTRGGDLNPVDPHKVINEAVKTLSERLRECGGRVSVGDGMPIVMADAVQLGQVFQNLVGNAVKFRSPDRPLKVSVSAQAEGDQATFSVTDNGIGIEERFLEKVFGAFQRLHTREDYEGAGVGLALCRKIIQRHSGRIWAESEPGRGSTFRFSLPVAPPIKETRS